MSISDFVSAAGGEIGYEESNNNKTKYNRWFYGNDTEAPWCAIFVSWCADQADILTTASSDDYPNIKKEASVSNLKTFYRKSRRDLSLTSNSSSSNYPKVGDLIFWEPNHSSHVGIITNVNGSTITVVSGNYGEKVSEDTFKNFDTSGLFDFIGSNHVSY